MNYSNDKVYKTRRCQIVDPNDQNFCLTARGKKTEIFRTPCGQFGLLAAQRGQRTNCSITTCVMRSTSLEIGDHKFTYIQ